MFYQTPGPNKIFFFHINLLSFLRHRLYLIPCIRINGLEVDGTDHETLVLGMNRDIFWRMDVDNTLLGVIQSLHSHNVKFIVAGGVAVVLQGVERLTMDLDTSVALDSENIQNFLLTMQTLGLVPRAPVNPEVLLDSSKRDLMVSEKGALDFTFYDPKNVTIQVDFFMSPELSYDKLAADTEDFV